MKRYIILSATLLISLGLAGQNINPEVQVTNEYQTRISDIEKQNTAMTVPDSMLRFDYHFDYSVFDSPYKGAYEFSPYAVKITPEARSYDGRKLYLNAGAGWTLHPELDAVWSVVDNKKVALDIFANGNGFYGDYRWIKDQYLEVDENIRGYGWDFRTVAGAASRFYIGPVILRAELGYDGIFQGHEISGNNSAGHAPWAAVKVSRQSSDGFSFNADVRYRYVNDNSTLMPAEDHDVLVRADLLPYGSGNAGIGVKLKYVYNTWYMGAGAVPHLRIRNGNWDIDAGAELVWNNADEERQFFVSPSVRAVYHAIPACLDVYATAIGSDNMMSYWDYKTRIHHYAGTFCNPQPVRDIADLCLGVDGFFGWGLKYDAKVGYDFMQNMPFWGLDANGKEALLFQDAQMLHADLDFSWNWKSFDVEGEVHYKWFPQELSAGTFTPSAVTARLSAGYNWMKRIYVNVNASMATQRETLFRGTQVVIPWYVDLGLKAEYKLNGNIGFWLKGQNLLNQDIRISPMYSQWGPAIIAGVTLSF